MLPIFFIFLLILFIYYIINKSISQENFNNNKNIHFLILNLDKNQDRYNNISNMLTKLNCSFTRIKAVDGNNIENDEDAKKILIPRQNLIGQTFKHNESNTSWIYDGSINKSFPCLHLDGHYGTKGLTLSNIKAFQLAETMNYEWYCILEDDAEIYQDTLDKMQKYINTNYDIILLDERANKWDAGGTSALLYNKRILNTLIKDLHPLSEFSINSYNYSKKDNLWDWKLWKYLNNINKNYNVLPCVKSGNFKSEIN
jgi:GR25 family glycosyltransferase involved in LPS biosynthesis